MNRLTSMLALALCAVAGTGFAAPQAAETPTAPIASPTRVVGAADKNLGDAYKVRAMADAKPVHHHHRHHHAAKHHHHHHHMAKATAAPAR